MLNPNRYCSSFQQGKRKTGKPELSILKNSFLPLVVCLLLSACGSAPPKAVESQRTGSSGGNSSNFAIAKPNSPQNPAPSQSSATSKEKASPTAKLASAQKTAPSPKANSKKSPIPKTKSVKSISKPAAKKAAKPVSTKNSKSVAKNIEVSIYRLDNQCNQLVVAEKITVPETEAVEKAVTKIIGNTDSADFSLSGYRVNVVSGVATIDFRTSANSRRQLQSLSNCEQLALFGSLRKTLMSNAGLKIKAVAFTNRGKKVKPE